MTPIVILIFLSAITAIVTSPVFATTVECPPYAGPNQRGLTTEAQLKAEHAQDIEALWSQSAVKTFPGVGDVAIAYKYFPIAAGQREKAAIVISSGRTEGLVKYPEFVYDLHRQGFAVYIHDHRGQGFSGRMVVDHPQMGHVETFDHYVADLKTFVHDIVNRNGHDKKFLIGHSMGGAIASLYMEEHPNDFDAAVLSSPMHEPDILGRGTQAACLAVKGASMAGEALRSMRGEPPKYTPNTGPYVNTPFGENDLTHSRIRYERMRRAYDENATAKIGGPSTKWVAAACWAGWNARRHADRIRIPVLVIQAGGDTIVKAEAQDEFCDKAGNMCANRKPFRVPDALHELFIECDKHRIPAVTRLLRFLDDQL